MTRAIAFLGTASDVGKSMVAAGFCRILSDLGHRVAPFKAQNMALNSYVTRDGGEIGRAQALQAQAARVEPSVLMNPILLKPEADSRSQVILRGRLAGEEEARSWFQRSPERWTLVRETYDELAADHDVVVLEGAGSAAELNLWKSDIVNWRPALHAEADVYLVGDINPGGIFAQLIGTISLLPDDYRARVRGLIVNRFRGDLSLFDEGVRLLEEHTGIPVVGVIPWLHGHGLEEEDSLHTRRAAERPFTDETLNIAVVLHPRMSNASDFDVFDDEPDVRLRWVTRPEDLAQAHVVILPGSKNTAEDLDYLRRAGFVDALLEHVGRGRELVGICGGYQMLGVSIDNPTSLERGGRCAGLGLLPVRTTMQPAKRTVQAAGVSALPGLVGLPVSGYEIHIGVTLPVDAATDARPAMALEGGVRSGTGDGQPDGGQPDGGQADGRQADGAWAPGTDTAPGLIWGTYLHGVFDEDRFRAAWLARLAARVGLARSVTRGATHRRDQRERALDRWADHLRAALDVPYMLAQLERQRGR